MKVWKRFGAVLLALAVLASMLTGTALAAEPGSGGRSRDSIAVQLDGRQLSFTDAAPEITNERTFLPFRAVLEAMGAEVDFDTETSTVSAQKDGVKLSMVPGQTALTVTEGGQTRTVEMDAAPYIKESNGRTYIPVRYAAEALGYSVGWDQDDRTVVLVDVEALLGDATFTLLDSLAANSKQSDIENMSLTGNLTVDVTDKTGTSLSAPISAKGSLDGIVSEKGAQLTWALDLTGLSSVLESMLGLAVLAAPLKGEVRMDLDSNMAYLTLPAVLTGGPADAWYSADISVTRDPLLAGLDMVQLQEQLQDAGFREVLVAVLQSLPMDDSAYSYEAVAMLAGLYKTMFSDQAFTQDGNTYTSKTTLEDMIDLEVIFTKEGESVTAMDVTMTADDKASGLKMAMSAQASPDKADVAMDLSVSDKESGTEVAMTMTMQATSDKVDMVMDLSVEDKDMAMACHLDIGCAPAGKAPETTLPAGVQATPLGSYGDGGAYPMAS